MRVFQETERSRDKVEKTPVEGRSLGTGGGGGVLREFTAGEVEVGADYCCCAVEPKGYVRSDDWIERMDGWREGCTWLERKDWTGLDSPRS